MYVGNSSDNELFAEYLDDIRIYGVVQARLKSITLRIWIGDQFPSVLITEKNLPRDSNPRHINALIGKDGLPVALTSLIRTGVYVELEVFDMNVTGDGNYLSFP